MRQAVSTVWRLPRTLVMGVSAAVLIFTASAGAAGAPVARAASDGSPAALQERVDAIVAAGAPGALLELQEDGRSQSVASGLADRAAGRELEPADRFRAGSITKTFVSTLTLQLVDEGALDLDATVADYLPRLLPNGDEITLRQLLNHTSGLFNYTSDPAFVEAAFLRGESFTPRELIAYSTSHPLLFPPGTDWSYSNTNYIVLGLLVRQAGAEPVRDQIEHRIADPLGLEKTRFPVYNEEIPGRHSQGYLGLPGGRLQDVTTRFNPSWGWAAGALLSNAPDLSDFYRALLSGELVDPALLEEMTTTVPIGPGQSYGLGLLSLDLPCGAAWGHDGLYIGYYAMSLSSEDGSRQVTMMMNVDPANGVPPDVYPAFYEALLTTFCGVGGVVGDAPVLPDLATALAEARTA